MTKNVLRRIIAASSWAVAKTMPRIPHSYTLRRDAPSDENFVAMVEVIRSHGYDERFFTRSYRYLDLDGWQYWTMGTDVESTTLINRARLKRPERTIERNTALFQPSYWPEVYCSISKQLIPRQTRLDHDSNENRPL